VGRLPGVGKVPEEKLKGFQVQTVADLRALDLATLERRFGRYGVRLHELARGIDNNEVIPNRRRVLITQRLDRRAAGGPGREFRAIGSGPRPPGRD
jgi:nucleotidyltransferase/DNA polymerase involved in DNA repair